ncbi:MAG: oligosaccharide flippase family protein [Ruminococcus sp.]|nr:oligosaccharide flippase family protein [Ruminococcus sp.]
MILLTKIRNNKKLLSNFSWLAILEIFILVAPLVTYPYLVRVLGRELYGWVITAQVTASYCTVLIDFGFKRISARHIATNTENPEKMGEIVSAILTIRVLLWLMSFIIYFAVIWLIRGYHEQLSLFLFSFLTTLSSVVFLDFYFQGTENMKYITIINIIVRGLFVAATFVVITQRSDYLYVPLLWGIGYVLGGIISLWIVFSKHNLSFKIPKSKVLKLHLKEGSIIFFSDAMLTIKDKLNYNIMGALLGMSDIVIYDVGSKISNLLQKPVTILSTALFPKMAKSPNIFIAKRTLVLITFASIIMVAIVNIFLPWIVRFFIDGDIDLNAIRLYTLAPIILGISSFIAVNIFYSFGKDKWILYSTYVTTATYIIMLIVMYFTKLLNSVFAFVFLTIASLLVEAIYRGIMCSKIIINKKS